MMLICDCLCITTLVHVPALCVDDIAISVKVSPDVIQEFATDKGNWITVHTDIPYNLLQLPA